MDTIRAKPNFDNIPHFTIILKFDQWIRSTIFTQLLNRLIRMFYDRGERILNITIDSFGFTSPYACQYYSWRTDKTKNGS